MAKKLGRSTYLFEKRPVILSSAAVGGEKERNGPLGKGFDFLDIDDTFGEKSWEQAENRMQQLAMKTALQKAHVKRNDLDLIFAGDLLNQCTGSSYGLKELGVPYLGLYGACSTMAEGLLMAGVYIDAGLAGKAAVSASSHFCSAERQYRFPLEYGSQRPPTSQWTATASAAVILGKKEDLPLDETVWVELVHASAGIIQDPLIRDANNMGAAMAPAAAALFMRYFRESSTSPQDYDRIFTGDLGQIGSELLYSLLVRQNIRIEDRHNDCGLLLFDREHQDVHAGGSGAGCCGSVLSAYILPELRVGRLSNVLFLATGALLSPTMVQQGLSIPGIAHLVHLRRCERKEENGC